MSEKNQERKPPKECARPYRLGKREVAMEETRAKILKAAREIILGENALDGFSLEAVAQLAGVTRVTVYHRFGSKRGLLEALFDEMGAQGRLGEKIPEIFRIPEPRAALQSYIEVFCEFWQAERLLNRRLRGFAALDEDFATAIASRYERRHHAIHTLLGRLEADTPREDAVQTVMALTGFEFYDVLASDERWQQEVAQMLFVLVLAAMRLK